MKKLYPLSVLLMSQRSNSSLIVPPKKLCKDCKFFIPSSDKCRKFGEVDLVNGKNEYMYANTARNREQYCGPEATYFEINKYRVITAPYYFVIKQWPFLAISSIFGLYMYAFIHTLTK